METFTRLFYQAKQIPSERALSFESIQETMVSIIEEVPSVDEKVREENGHIEYEFSFFTDEMTEEEIEAKTAELEAAKQEALKKAKKKLSPE